MAQAYISTGDNIGNKKYIYIESIPVETDVCLKQ